MKPLYCFITALLCLGFFSAAAQKLQLAGDCYLLLNGDRFPNRKVSFSAAEGDWFITPKDAHASLTLYTQYDNRRLGLSLEWDGITPIVINEETRHLERKAEFLLSLPDKDSYGDGLNTIPEDEDEIRVKVIRMDETTLLAEISGIATSHNNKIKVSGIVNLKKPSVKKIASASYKDCDNVVHDKLTGAQNRSATECEQKFDLDVKTAMYQSIQKSIAHLEANGWLVKSLTELKPVEGVDRSSGKYMTKLGSFEAELQLDPSSPAGQQWYKKSKDAMEAAQASGPSKESMDKFLKIGYEIRNNTNISLQFSINHEQMLVSDYKSEHKLLQVPGAAYAIQLAHAPARTGGGEENALDVTEIFFGRFRPGLLQKEDDGGSSVSVNGYFNRNASLLSVQNLRLRIEASAPLADQLLKDLDTTKLVSLIEK